jgi:hypothetical protein
MRRGDVGACRKGNDITLDLGLGARPEFAGCVRPFAASLLRRHAHTLTRPHADTLTRPHADL